MPAAPRQTGASPAPAPGPSAPAAAGRPAGADGTGTLSASGQGNAERLIARWGGQIRARIDRRKPAGIGRGTATVMIVVGRDGQLIEVTLSASSGAPAIDAAALESVRRAGRFPPAPAGLDLPRYSFRLPVTFR